MGPDKRLARIAGRQSGVISWSQLRACGLSPDAIKHRLGQGRLHRIFRGVYLVGHAVPPPLAVQTAAVLTTEGTLVHDSAGHLWDLRPRPPRPHVAVRRGDNRRAGLVVHRFALQPHEITRRHGLPLTTPARTVLDLAATLPTQELERVVAEAHAQRLVTAAALASFLERTPPRPGRAKLREILQQVPRRTRSELERQFLALIDRAQLPRPEMNVQLGPHEVDALWRQQRLVVELDGYAFHSSRRAFEHDRGKDAALAAEGLRVARLTWRRLEHEPEATTATLVRALYAPSP